MKTWRRRNSSRPSRSNATSSRRVSASNVSIMDEHGIDTAELKQGLISVTGKLSQDVLDVDVATGLAEAWFA